VAKGFDRGNLVGIIRSNEKHPTTIQGRTWQTKSFDPDVVLGLTRKKKNTKKRT